jgi:4-hydroxy 2-oxovalerate aldolase
MKNTEGRFAESRLRVLDCTLRDGGYCNQWEFGFENTKKIINGLVEAGIDIIECGFLADNTRYRRDVTIYTDLKEVSNVIPRERNGKLFVCMVNYGEYTLDELPEYDGTSLDGIRVAFHKKDMAAALEFCKGVKAKGYKVFIQAMVSLNYTDEEFMDLIRRSNTLEPYAFYIVDSFGVMKKKDLTRLFYMVEHNIKESIHIGYHSHNNMQLAYSNAQALADIQTKRSLIIDSSIFGMGRGAGNLNTELFVEYMNDNIGTEYVLKPLLTIIDEVLNNYYQANYWGYSLPNYLSAAHNCHPNYASYLDDKKTLTVENIDEIFSMMEEEKRSGFDKKYIEELYLRYMANGKIYGERLFEIRKILEGRKVLVIGPGKSGDDEKEKVAACAASGEFVSISVNFDYQHYDTDFIFLSNLRRFRELNADKRKKMIVTSNIPADGVYLKVKYTELLNNIEAVKDNAGMMLVKYLMKMGVDEILLAGFDGYSYDISQNYAEQQVAMFTKRAILDAMNTGMSSILSEYAKHIKIEFLTEPRFIRMDTRILPEYCEVI